MMRGGCQRRATSSMRSTCTARDALPAHVDIHACTALNCTGAKLHHGSGGRIRTCDLRVMSPMSYQLLYPAINSGLRPAYGNSTRKPILSVNKNERWQIITCHGSQAYRTSKSYIVSVRGAKLHRGSGGRIRTCDLRVMSPMSYQLLYPAVFVCQRRFHAFPLKRRCFISPSRIILDMA